jgi:dolichol-phosphate mannosyltransferase
VSRSAEIDLGIVCPMANESETAAQLVDAVLAEVGWYGFRSVQFFVVVDRTSTDGTPELLREVAARAPELRVVWAPENTNVADAYVRGYREAIDAGCEWILELDAGFSHRPQDIPQFFDAMAGGYDCVFGSRFAAGGRNRASLGRRSISRVGTLLANALLGTRLTDMTSGFELFSRESLKKVLAAGIRSKGPFFQTEIKTHCRRLRVAEVPIEYGGGSHAIGPAALGEALLNLAVLFRLRLQGRL